MNPAARLTCALLAFAFVAPAILAAPASAFLTNGSWIANDPIPFDPLHLASTTVVASNHSGGVLAVGYEWFDGTATLYAFTYSLAGGWAGRTMLNASPFDSWMDPVCALGDDGTAVAAWVYETGPNATIWASLYTPGGGWDAAAKLGGSPDAFGLSAAVGSDGRAMVTWTDNVTDELWVRYAERPAGQSWSAAADLDSSPGGFQARLDAGPSGTILAAWPSRPANDSVIRYARFTPGVGWSTAVNVSAAPVGVDSFSVSVKSVPDGGAFVSWSESNLYVNVSARHLRPGGTWDPVHPLTTSGFVYTAPALTVDAGGNATVAWVEAIAGGFEAQAARFQPGSGWGANVSVGESDMSYSAPVLASGADGVTTALWAHDDTHGHPMAYAQFVPGLGWSDARPIMRENSYADGTAVAFENGYVLYVATYGQAGNILFDSFPPALSVAGPADGSPFAYPVVDVTGTTEPGAFVEVNGQAATVDAAGAWTARVELGTGANVLRTVATDPAGNPSYENRTVTFTDPVPALEAALAQAQANASAAQAAAAAAAASLNATNGQLADMQASLSANLAAQAQLQAQISALNQSVANTRPAAASDGLALWVAAVGVALGAGGIAVGMMAARRSRPTPKDPYPDPKDAK